MCSSGAEPSALVVADLLWVVKGELTIQDVIAATHAHIAGGEL